MLDTLSRNSRMVIWAAMLLILAGACHKKIVPNNSNNNPATLVFGQSGGVTGKTTEFSLVVNGELYRHETVSRERVLLKKLKLDDSRPFFAEAEALHLMDLDFNKPFNINYYIIYKKGVRENRINWGDSRLPPPGEVQSLYDKLLALTR